MRSLLIAEGVPQEHVFSDPVSVNTRQNLDNAWAILSELGCKRPVVVTSDYHLPRAMALAEDEGLDATGVGARTLPQYWLKNYGREGLSWIKYWMQKYLHLPLE